MKTSIATKDGVVASLPSGSTVKVVDNSISFADIGGGNWASDAVAFVSARRLFCGTSPTNFSPNAEMDQGMITTVLHRLSGADVSTGANWYDAGMRWAVEHGVISGYGDGSLDPDGTINRAEFAQVLMNLLENLTLPQ